MKAQRIFLFFELLFSLLILSSERLCLNKNENEIFPATLHEIVEYFYSTIGS